MTIPCKDCITLAICNVQFKSNPEFPSIESIKLTIKCSLLEDYIKKQSSIEDIEDLKHVVYTTILNPIMDFFEAV